MDSDRFEARMRALEYYHSLRLVPGTWTVVRVDGRGFTRFTGERFEKPFDLRFRDLMLGAARALMEEMGGLYAYTESDEISVLFGPDWDFFDRELEKVVSLSAALASSTFTLAAGAAVQFDSRVWVGIDPETVVDYFRWRQTDAGRCALNGWCYWTLRKAGHGAQAAASTLERMRADSKHELLFRHGINFAELPAWQRRGLGIRWETYEKPGFNPNTGQEVTALRRRLAVDEELPVKDDYAGYVRAILASGRKG